MNNIEKEKKKLRESQSLERDKYHKSFSKSFKIKNKMLNILYEELNLKKVKFVSSFFSIKSEISSEDLNDFLWKQGKVIGFPIVVKKKYRLIFREYNRKQKTSLGKFNILEPNKDNDEIIPKIIFVPCLAFDEKGYRLGYGGGYYDRTFAYFKEKKYKFVTVGFAYDNQKVKKIPVNKYDYRLNYVFTEKKIYNFD